VAGQDIRKWTFSAGPAVAATPPRESFDPSLGVAFSGTYFRFNRSDVAVGVEFRAAAFPIRMGGEVTCVSVCGDPQNPRVLFVSGVGFAAQVGSVHASGTHLYAQARVVPSVVASSIRDQDGASVSFSPTLGATAGIARGRGRFGFGLDLLPNTQGKAPIVWSLTFGVER
jgi:hypothetical protein